MGAGERSLRGLEGRKEKKRDDGAPASSFIFLQRKKKAQRRRFLSLCSSQGTIGTGASSLSFPLLSRPSLPLCGSSLIEMLCGGGWRSRAWRASGAKKREIKRERNAAVAAVTVVVVGAAPSCFFPFLRSSLALPCPSLRPRSGPCLASNRPREQQRHQREAAKQRAWLFWQPSAREREGEGRT